MSVDLLGLYKYFLIFLPVIFGVLVGLMTLQRRILDKENENSLFLLGKRARTSNLHAIYHFLSNFALTRHFIRRIRLRYELIEPDNKTKVEADTLRTSLMIISITAIPILLGIFIDFTLFSTFAVGIFSYALGSFLIFRSIEKKENLLNEQMIDFMDKVGHHYYSKDSIDGALEETLLSAQEPIKVHMEKIRDILASEEIEEDMEGYLDLVPNHFLQMFLSNCILITKFDDKLVDGESLFLRNMSYLKEEISIEKLKKDKLERVFGGAVIVAILPLLALQAISNWSLSIMPEVEKYYKGPFGIVVPAVTCLLTLVVYSMLNRMREASYAQNYDHTFLRWIASIPIIKNFVEQKNRINYGKTLRMEKLLRQVGENLSVGQFYVKKLLNGLGMIILCIVLCFFAHKSFRTINIEETGSLKNLSTYFTEDAAIDEMKTAVVSLADEFKYVDITKDMLIKEIMNRISIKNELILNEVADDILRRIEVYHSDYFHWWELLLILGCGVLGYNIPYLLLLYQKEQIKASMENEIIEFQSIILMMMYLDRISSQDILDWMEKFARIFHEPINKCLNSFNSGDEEALEEMKESETYAPFLKLADNLIDTDKIGVRRAFREVEADRKRAHDSRKAANEKYVEDKGVWANVLAFVPFYFAMIVYLGIPFIIESLNQYFAFDLDSLI